MLLKDILGPYETPHSRVAVHVFRNRRTLRESRRPQIGIYWWLPTPDGDWELDVYYASSLRGMPLHYRVWPQHVIDRLAVLWDRDPNELRREIGDCYAGLPRGRVDKAREGYLIYHGGDAPVANPMPKIMSAFNLRPMYEARPDSVHVIEDEHWGMIPEDPPTISKVLGTDLGLSRSR